MNEKELAVMGRSDLIGEIQQQEEDIKNFCENQCPNRLNKKLYGTCFKNKRCTLVNND